MPDSELEHTADLIRSHPEYLDVAAVAAMYRDLGFRPVSDPKETEVSDRIRSALAEGRPLSVVRIGDGEANILSFGGYPETPMLDRYCALKHIGAIADRICPDEAWLIALREVMLSAILQADVVGVIGLWRPRGTVAAEDYADGFRNDLRGGSGHWRAIEYLLRLARLGLLDHKLITSAHLYFGVLDNLQELLRSAKRVLLVTSRRATLAALQARNPEVRFSFIEVGRRSEPPARAPDFLAAIEAQLPRDLSGTLCLVGAGPWAEIYCAWIKQRGGVGVDLGSGFDLLVNRISRPVHKRLGLDKANPYSILGAANGSGGTVVTGGSLPSTTEGRALSEGGRVAVLLAVYDGEAFLQEQLDTLARQSVPHVDIWVSDDGSSDGSSAIVDGVAQRWLKGSFRIVRGPGRGFAENFRSLVTNREIEADYYAFCDQDDLWDADKLARATTWLDLGNSSEPRLFGSRTRIIDEHGTVSGLSPLFRHTPGFRNALVQSIAGGKTMVFNRAARELMATAAGRAPFVAHDWWAYQIVTGAGGTCRYDPEPAISYRQHGANRFGENYSWKARLRRIRGVLDGTMRGWNARNLAALEACSDLLTPEAVEALAHFRTMRDGNLGARLAAFMRSGIYRQTPLGQFGLLVACALRRL